MHKNELYYQIVTGALILIVLLIVSIMMAPDAQEVSGNKIDLTNTLIVVDGTTYVPIINLNTELLLKNKNISKTYSIILVEVVE